MSFAQIKEDWHKPLPEIKTTWLRRGILIVTAPIFIIITSPIWVFVGLSFIFDELIIPCWKDK